MADVAQLVEQRFVVPLVAGSRPVVCPIDTLTSLCGGIGRHDRLKICCLSGRVSSSLTRGTIHLQNSMNYYSIIFTVLLLGLVEGFTEFLPVSSTGHLILINDLMKNNIAVLQNGLFEVFIQAGAVLAVLVLYRQKIFDVLTNPCSQNSSRFSMSVIIGATPIAILGVVLYDFIKEVLFTNTSLIAYMLIIGGIFLIWIENKNIKPTTTDIDSISWKQALRIGFFQILALIPGVSRSGATIAGGLIFKLDRKTATEFSFFLAIPVIMGASFFDLIKNIHSIDLEAFLILMFGFIISFLSSLLFIKWFINFVSNKDFKIFGYYRVVLGIIILLFSFL